jgi:hypothetical protein
MSLHSDILRIIDNPENMSQHGRRMYWTDEIILLVRQDAVQRIEALPWTSETWLAHAERAANIAAIKGEQ